MGAIMQRSVTSSGIRDSNALSNGRLVRLERSTFELFHLLFSHEYGDNMLRSCSSKDTPAVPVFLLHYHFFTAAPPHSQRSITFHHDDDGS